MTRPLRALALAALLPWGLAAACGDPAPACTVKDNGDGTRTVACRDGTAVTLPSGEGTCTLGVGEDGGKVIVCSDGTEVRIGPDGMPVFPGGGLVSGNVRLFGRDRHDGVTVTSRWTGERAVTAEDGTFRLEVRAGNHDLVFAHPDFDPVTVPGVPAVGPTSIPPVVLHPATRLSGDGAIDWPSPDESAVAFRPAGNRLLVRRVADGTDVSLSETASFPPAWDGVGAAVAFLEGQDSWTGEATLVRFDLASGTRAELSRVATRALSWPGGGLLFWEAGSGGAERLVRWTADGGPVDLGAAMRWTNPVFSADGGAVFFGDELDRLVWREADGRGAVLDGARSWGVVPAPEGPWVSIQGLDGTLEVLDRRDGSRVDLGARSFVFFSPDGRLVLFARDAGFVVRRLDTGEETSLPIVSSGLTSLDFTADGGVLWSDADGLNLARPDGTVEVLVEGRIDAVLLGPDRIRAITRPSGAELWDVHVVAGVGDPLSFGPADWVTWTADGRRLLARRGDRLLKIDAVDGGTKEFAAGVSDQLPSPDGRRVLWTGAGGEDGKPILVVHDLPTGDEVRLAEGAFDSFAFSRDGAAVVLRVCDLTSCELRYWTGGDEVVPVTDAVSGYEVGRRLLFYRFQPSSDHVEASRSGLWYARLPVP